MQYVLCTVALHNDASKNGLYQREKITLFFSFTNTSISGSGASGAIEVTYFWRNIERKLS